MHLLNVEGSYYNYLPRFIRRWYNLLQKAADELQVYPVLRQIFY